MTNVLVYAKTAATRKLYHQILSKRDIETFRAKDGAEVFLILATFEVDTIVLVDEGALGELETVLEVIEKRYDQKRRIIISPVRSSSRGAEYFSSNRDFFASEGFPLS